MLINNNFHRSNERLTEDDFDDIFAVEIQWDEFVDREELALRDILPN